MATTTPLFDRRGIFGATAVAALMLAPAAQATLADAVAVTDRTAWDRAFRAFELAVAADKAFDIQFAALHSRWSAEIDAVPHVTLGPDPFSGRNDPISTADGEFVRRARRLVDDVRQGKTRLDPLPDVQAHYELCREVVEADNRRETEIEAISTRLGYDQAEAKWEDLGSRACNARAALMKMPAPDVAALKWKLDYLLEDDGSEGRSAWTNEFLEQTRADVHRLLPAPA